MTITVKYFGAIADITHKKEEQFLLESSSGSVELLQLELEKKYPSICQNSYSIAVNQLVTHQNVALKDQDEIALLPPFAGG